MTRKSEGGGVERGGGFDPPAGPPRISSRRRRGEAAPPVSLDSLPSVALMQQVIIRVAEPEDGSVLRRLRREAESYHARLRPDYFRVPVGERPMRIGLPGVVLVAEEIGEAEREVVGYVAVKMVDTPPDPGLVPRPRAHVETLVVEEGRRRRGIGRMLMQAAREWAERRGATELILTVWNANRAAEAFYRALGYEPIARVLGQRIGR